MNGDVTKHVIAYNGSNFVTYGPFTGLQGDKGDKGDTGTFDTSNDVTLGNRLFVSNDVSFNKNSYIDGTLTVDGNTSQDGVAISTLPMTLTAIIN